VTISLAKLEDMSPLYPHIILKKKMCICIGECGLLIFFKKMKSFDLKVHLSYKGL